MQPAFLLSLLRMAKMHGLNTVIDTCGVAPWPVLAEMLSFTDCFLYDLKLMNSDTHQHMTGRGNRLVLENYIRLKKAGAHIEVRIPVIPGVNALEKEITAIFEFLRASGRPDSIRLIPYHTSGTKKYRQLGMTMWEQEVFELFPLDDWQAKADRLCK